MAEVKDEFWNLLFADIEGSHFLEGSTIDEAIEKLVAHLRTLEPKASVQKCRQVVRAYLWRSAAVEIERIIKSCLDDAEAMLGARSASEGAHGEKDESGNRPGASET